MHKADFLGVLGVSYFFRTEQGSLLYGIGFGVTSPTLPHNVLEKYEWKRLYTLNMDHQMFFS